VRAVDIIAKKRDGGILSPPEIAHFVEGAIDGSWREYQVAALLMAIVIRGMTREETAALTDAMVRSGTRVDLRDLPGRKVDKHSTGGVGDKTSLIVAPAAAACGVVVPMMSGRALGHTGGTLDKLESIPGFRARLSIDEMKRVLATTGCALIGATDRIAPADRRLYALRDVTATVESIPLISSSIMSKKIAEGIDALVLDVKVGSGAFIKAEAGARQLAESLVSLGTAAGVATTALLTDMDAPLGCAVGNAMEVAECVEVLRGGGPPDLVEVSVALGARMLVLGRVAGTVIDGERMFRGAVTSGRALDVFRQTVAAQHGDPRIVDDVGRLPHAGAVETMKAPRAGFVARVDAERVGRAAAVLGAGRDTVTDAIDPAAGILVRAKPGVPVERGQPVFEIRYRDRQRLQAAMPLLEDALAISDVAPPARPLLIGEVGHP
jgi:pyrimidine-nucleoside phosphorylase